MNRLGQERPAGRAGGEATIGKPPESSQTTGMEGAKGNRTVMGDTPELESAIQTMVENYDKYSSKETLFTKGGIRKSKFREMLKNELSHKLTNTENKKAVDELFCDLNENQDRVIDFDEYWSLIGKIVIPLSRIKEYQVEKMAAESKGNK